MTFNIAKGFKPNNKTADVPLDFASQTEIFFNEEELMTQSHYDSEQQEILLETAKVITEITGEEFSDPYRGVIDNLELGVNMLVNHVNPSVEGVQHDRYELIKNKHKIYNAAYSLKNDPKYKDDPFIKGLVASDEELKNVINNETLNNKHAARLMRESDYHSMGSEFTGAFGAQMTDPANLLYVASIPFVATGFGAVASVFGRIALWLGEGAISGVIIEEFQQQRGSRKVRDELDLHLTNPNIRKEIEKHGVDPDSLKLTDEELELRLTYAWMGGLILGGVGATVAEGGSVLFRKIMRGDAATLKTIDDAAEVVHKIQLNKQAIKNLSAEDLAEHVKKIAVAGHKVNFNKKYNLKNPAEKPLIEDLDKATDELAGALLKEGETLTKTERKRIKSLFKQHNYNVKTHNSVVKNQILKYQDESGEWKIEFGDTAAILKPDDLQKTAEDIVKNFSKIETSNADKKWLMTILNRKTAFGGRDVFNSNSYQKSLSKDLDVARIQQLDDQAILNLVDMAVKQYSNNATKRLGKPQSMQEIIVDLLEVTYTRDVIPTNVSSIQRATLQDLMNRLDHPDLHKMDFKTTAKYDSDDFIKEIYNPGSTSNKAASIFARQAKLMLEDVRLIKNKLGGSIAKFEDYFPQVHHVDKVGKAGVGNWLKTIKDNINTEQVAKNLELDANAGNFEELLDQKLKDIYDNILLGDTKSSFVSRPPESGGIKMKGSEHRILVFKDAQSWLNYNNQFGKNPQDILSQYMDHAAMDIAFLKTMGPSVHTNAIKLNQFAKDFDKRNGIKALNIGGSKFERVMDHLSGKEYSTGFNNSGSDTLSFLGSETRAFLVSAQLGSAYIMTLADQTFGALTRILIGMPAAKGVGNYMRFIKNSKNSKMLAREAGVVAHEITEDLKNAGRLAGEQFGDGPMSWMAQKLMKVSLLAPGTTAARTSFKFEFQFHLTKIAQTNYNLLDDKTLFMYKRYNITKADHDVLAKTKMYKSRYDHKVQYKRIGDIENPEVRQKFYSFMFAETETAVPTIMARSRSAMMNNTRRGTAQGEINRSFWLFKNFPMTIMYTQIARAINVTMTHPNVSMRVGYASGLIVGTTLTGTVLNNVREIIKGEEPSPINKATLGRGLMYGGGLGIFGDFFLHDTSKFGRSAMSSLAGPMFGLINDISSLGLNRLHGSLYENDAKVEKLPAELITFAKRYTPYNNLWFTRAATDRLIFENLSRTFDPDYKKKQKKYRKRLEKERRDVWLNPNLTIKKGANFGNFFSYKENRD